MKDIKVLVISHNAFSLTNNIGKTMSAFFNNWRSENIAQLYLHSEIPNTNICENFFRITDFDIIESIFKFKSPGTILSKKNINIDSMWSRINSGIKSDIYNYGRKRKPHIYLLRNLLWATNKWKTTKLSKWIDDFNPEVVFYAAGDYSFSMKIALEICREKNLPLVVFFGDEYFFLDIKRNSFINWLNIKIFKKIFTDMFSYLNAFITASDKMQEKYSTEFKKQGYTIMTSTEITEASNANKTIQILKVSYIGNLGLGRWRSLVEIGRFLKQEGLLLDVYSGEKRESIVSHLNIDNGIYFHGSIPASSVKQVIVSSTIIIHVESMDDINSQKTRYSMSTKIAESLGSGVCLFAYGPDDVSSMEYLIENDAACVVTKKEDLQVKLKEILKNEGLRRKYINNALRLASERHNFKVNTQLFYKIIKDANENWESRLENEIITG